MKHYIRKVSQIAAMTGLILGFASCAKEEEQKLTTSTSIETYNLVMDDEGNTYVGPCRYLYWFDEINGNATVTASSLRVPGGEDIKFASAQMPYRSGYTNQEIGYGQWILFGAEDATGSDNVSLADLRCELTQAAVLTYNDVNGVSISPSDLTMPRCDRGNYYTVMHYRVADKYNVRTFWPDMIYRGVGDSTSDTGSVEVYQNRSYRVVMDIATGTADVILYDYRAENLGNGMAASDVIGMEGQEQGYALRGLTLSFDAAGYRIEGNNITAERKIGEEYHPIFETVVTNFLLTSTTNMAGITLRYDITGGGRQTFEGKSIALCGL